MVHQHPRLRVPLRLVTAAIAVIVRGERKRLHLISVIFVDDGYIRKINRAFLLRDEVTDVISFPLADDAELDGEIYVNLDRARRQAREHRIGFREEVARLVIHGVLHLCGYTDNSSRKKATMAKREDYYLRKIGFLH